MGFKHIFYPDCFTRRYVFVQLIYSSTVLGLPDFTTAVFDVIATFETERPYLNNQNTKLDVTCDIAHHVAYLIVDFRTESCCDFVTLTDLVDNNRILGEFSEINF